MNATSDLRRKPRHLEPGEPRLSPQVQRLPVLILLPHSRCNCRCLMCDIWKVTEAREITASELERHLADIEQLGVEWVVFSGGEPLMHSDLFRLSGMVRARGIRTTILSSGLLLARHAASIAAATDETIVSLDGPPAVHDEIRGVSGAFKRLAEGVCSIRRVSSEYPIAARCTVQARNAAHLRATVHAARDLGLRSISFLAADLHSTAFNRPIPWPAEKTGGIAPNLTILEQEIEALIARDAGDGFVRENPAKLRRIVAHFCGQHIAPRCNAPWVSAVVESNGDVRPCFFHPPIGNTGGRSLAEVLNGPVATEFREGLDVANDPTCRRCVCSLYWEPGSR